MQSTTVGPALAFGAGLLSFLSPCVLPLIPGYLTFLTGLGVEDVTKVRRTTLAHALLFVLGFSLIFLALGATASVLGRVLLLGRGWISRVGGALIIIFGLYLLGGFDSQLLSRERRVHLATKPVGYLGSLLVGVAFGAGWTPCIGPILGSILVFSSSSADLGHGLLLLGAYSAGLAVPFLLSAVALEHFLATFARIRHRLVWVTRISGAMLVVVGLLMVTNYLAVLATTLQRATPAALRDRL